jgi:hypothetical protein
MTAPLFAEPTHNGLWYIADAQMRNVTGAFFNSKTQAVAKIRAIQPLPRGALFYRVQEFGRLAAERN